MSGIINNIRYVGNSLPEETEPMECLDESDSDYFFDCSLRSSRSEDGIVYLEFSDDRSLRSAADPEIERDVVKTFVEYAGDTSTDDEQVGKQQYFKMKLEENPDDIDWEIEVVNTVERDAGGKEHKYVFVSS